MDRTWHRISIYRIFSKRKIIFFFLIYSSPEISILAYPFTYPKADKDYILKFIVEDTKEEIHSHIISKKLTYE